MYKIDTKRDSFGRFWEALLRLLSPRQPEADVAEAQGKNKKKNKKQRKLARGCPNRNGPLVLPDNTAWLGLKRLRTPLFVRDCYKALWDKVQAHPYDVLITGTPGTGKTGFMAYMLYRLMTMRTRAFDVVLDFDEIFCLITSHNELRYGTRGPSFAEQLAEEKNLYLFDARRGVPGPLSVLCKTVVTSSPDPGHFKEFKKEIVLTLFMPVWTRFVT